MRWLLWSLLVLVALATTAGANFADTQGFSGKHGVDCGTCHVPMPGGLDSPPTPVLDGLPASWDANATYTLTIKVIGGPARNPAPNTPQAGFDLETDGGILAAGAGMDGLLRFPNPEEATYTGAGTLRADWNVLWTAPNASFSPRTIRFWLAVLGANGNHVMDGPDTAGERGDRFATLVKDVDPSPATLEAWANRPIPPPILDALAPTLDPSAATILVKGTVASWADGAEWRLDNATWAPAIGAPSFSFVLPAVAPGAHFLEVRAMLGERTSDAATHAFTAPGTASAPALETPAPEARPWMIIILPILAGLVLAPFLLKLLR